MTNLQKIQLKLSETRSKANSLQAIETPTSEQRAELVETRTALTAIEREYQTALRESPGPEQVEHRIEGGATTPEQRAFAILEDQIHPADYLGEIQGQAAEYRAELGMSKGIPHISLLDPVERVELRRMLSVPVPVPRVSVRPQFWGSCWRTPLQVSSGCPCPVFHPVRQPSQW